jgi:hypothetical protein
MLLFMHAAIFSPSLKVYVVGKLGTTGFESEIAGLSSELLATSLDFSMR